MHEYDPQKIEKKWQEEWDESGIYRAEDHSKKPKYYALIEFPYPSGDGLHVGHPRPYIGLDIIARKRRMEGHNVLYPIGWDAFGLPTENYAIKTGKNPRVVTKENTDTFRRQIQSLGVSFDWSREINTTDPKYYKWTQWIFLKFLEKGLAYKARIPINWCLKCRIGLANEEVVDDNCERCGTPVEKKEKEQWMLAITKYADRLYDDLETIDYPERVKIQQRNWIGRSEGAEIEFKIDPPPAPSQREGNGIPVFIQSEKDKNLEKILLELLDLSIRNKKRLVISGGWAVDIYADRRIRNHNDIDGNVLYTDTKWWKEQLEKIGFKQIPPDDFKKDPSYHLNFVKEENGENYKVDLIGIGFNDKKEIYDMEWSRPDSWGFGQDNIITRTFKGKTVEIFSVPVQLWLKIYDREKDRIDRMILNSISTSLSEDRGEFGYHTTDLKTWRALQDRVLEMRANPTKAEDVLWQSLRKNLTGFHFRRQHIIGKFVVDFVCLEKSLIVEVDGDIHDYQKKKDEARTKFLKQNSFRVIRFSNKEVLEDVEAVVNKINEESKALPFGEGLGGVIKVFTTRPDTIFGATFVAIAGKEDKFTGRYVTNPATKEKIPVWEAEYVMSDYGTGAIMAVPAHDERDLEFAKKYNLPIKQVIGPVFENTTEYGKVRDELPIFERDSIMAIVKHWAEDKYIGLRYKNVDWQTLITGGPEGGQDTLDGAIAEIVQETGYLHPRFVKNLNKVHSKFYHVPKKINRFAHFTTFYFELEDGDRQEVSEEDKKLHEAEWLTKEEMTNFLSPRAHKYIWKSLFGEAVYEDEGILTNSGEFDGFKTEEARNKITEKFGEAKVSYKLRDWVFSRQRYWGEPIPVVHCDKCGVVPVPEEELPVLLPEVEKYEPGPDGESPLANITEWVNTKCPQCGGKAKRETDVMPNWAGSSWYFLAYLFDKEGFTNPVSIENWKLQIENFRHFMPVDWYNGGMEHTVLHLLYSRFWNKFLYDLKLVPTSEPYKKRTSHGLILAEGGEKMSKSKGNVINPDTIVKHFGADTLRLYEMFMGPFEQAIAWNEEALVGPRRFLEKVWRLQFKISEGLAPQGQTLGIQKGLTFSRKTLKSETLMHQTIKKVSEDIESMGFNTAVSTLMIYTNALEKQEKVSKKEFETLLLLLAPFAPHITEELWKALGHDDSIHTQNWPTYDPRKLLKDEITLAVQIDGKVRASLTVSRNQNEEEIKIAALSLPEVEKWLNGREPKRIIVVLGRIISIVT